MVPDDRDHPVEVLIADNDPGYGLPCAVFCPPRPA